MLLNICEDTTNNNNDFTPVIASFQPLEGLVTLTIYVVINDAIIVTNTNMSIWEDCVLTAGHDNPLDHFITSCINRAEVSSIAQPTIKG